MSKLTWKSEEFVSTMELISSKLSIDILAIPNFNNYFKTIHIGIKETVLFRWGSALSFSNDEESKVYALKIAHFLLLSEDLDDKYRELGYTLLKRLNNRNSAHLVLERKLINEEPKSGFFSILNQSRVDFESTFELNGENIYLNRFQGELLTAIENFSQIAVSAPTSAGKSFIVERWIAQAFQNGSEDIALVVPTRALIHQMEIDMRQILKVNEINDVQIVTVPSEIFIDKEKRSLLIFTQERFHIYQNVDHGNRKLSALIVDEAQKINDGSRGILLQQVIETAAFKNDKLKLIFLTPSSKNPQGLLIKGHGSETVVDSSDVTVGQNLYWLTQRPRKPTEWNISLVIKSGEQELGYFSLQQKPGRITQRLSYIAFHIGRNDPGNIVFVNGPAEAETVAWQLAKLIESVGFEADEDLKELEKFVSETIHPQYALVNTLHAGVAFHYGNMPLLIKSEIERLFSLGKIRYLVCTSTLVEGVNTACQNLFLRGPKRGKSNKMNALDFWNLAGRAGRWGKEFEGNVFCVDAKNPDLWENGHAPKAKERFEIKKALDHVLENGDSLLENMAIMTPTDVTRTDIDKESTLNYLFNKYYTSGSDPLFMSSRGFESDRIKEIENAVIEASEKISVNRDSIARNPGINPLYMDGLLKYFSERGHEPEKYLPPDPSSDDAVNELGKVFARTYKHLGSELGPASYGRSFSLAILVVNWMRGLPLRAIINSQVKYDKQKKKTKFKLASTIRNVLSDIEQFARYQAPKYIACYSDLLNQYYIEIGRSELCKELEDFNLYLEFGASQVTQISLMSLGLSRSTSIQLSEYIVNDKMAPDEVLETVRKMDIDSFDFSILMKKEIEVLLS